MVILKITYAFKAFPLEMIHIHFLVLATSYYRKPDSSAA